METAHLSLVTISNWPGMVSAARVVYRQGPTTMIYPTDFTAFLMHDLTTPASQAALDSQHKQVFTDAAIAQLKRRVRKFYAKRPDAHLLIA